MINNCPITSYHNEYKTETYCMEHDCAWWDKENAQCCIKTFCLAAAGKKNGETSNSTAQAYYIPPSSYCNTNIITNPATVPARDYPEITVYCSAKTDPEHSFEEGV